MRTAEPANPLYHSLQNIENKGTETAYSSQNIETKSLIGKIRQIKGVSAKSSLFQVEYCYASYASIMSYS
jgi:hypothetical protein